MNIARNILILAVPLCLTACGNFEWFPEVDDSTAPTIAATVGGNAIFNNRTTHVATLPASVVFTANEVTTIYYTTNGATEPTTASPSVQITTSSGASVANLITLTNTILWFFGIDQSNNSTAKIKGTIKSP